MAAEIPELLVVDLAAWRRWLQVHHADPSGVWLILARKGTDRPTSLSYDDALDEAVPRVDRRTTPSW